MLQRPFRHQVLISAIHCLALFVCVPSAIAQPANAQLGHDMSRMDMSHMTGHMYMTPAATVKPGDRAKADAIVAAAKEAMQPYQDFHKALADGYEIFRPESEQSQYHFTNYQNARAAALHFDPRKPTSLLYKKTGSDGYKLVGVMYTDRVNASEKELNTRVPLSVAHWHQHLNFCKAPAGRENEYVGPNAKFGLLGSITTQQACDAAGGQFHAHLFGWMVHVYPYETDPQKVWALDNDDDGHSNMNHDSMGGMKMN